MNKPTVFIHSNNKQLLGARVAEYALKSRSKSPDSFEVKILRLEETQHLYKRQGKQYLRKGKLAIWKNDDLQSFSPLRMMVPQVMNYVGQALIIDPDIFAVGDVYDLLTLDMQGKSILCRNISEGYKSNGNSFYATSVMLLNCNDLTHWQWDKQIDDMFDKKLDYGPWISLKLEDSNRIGDLAEEWNHFDTLNDQTKLLHNTERSTQPWKTGLPIDYDTTQINRNWIANFLNIFKKQKKYIPHPDIRQEQFFLELLKECIEENIIDEEYLLAEIAASNLRKDIFQQLEKIKK